MQTLQDLNCSTIVFGTMRLGNWGANMNAQQYLGMIEECLNYDITTMDLADIYGDYSTETEFGNALKIKPSIREKMQIVTKCGINMVCAVRPQYKIKSYDSSAKHIITSLENSLQQLGIEQVDLLLLHRPDWLIEPDEVAKAFQQLNQQGKVRSFGVSNYTPSQFNLLNKAVPLVTNQVEVSLLHLNCFNDGTLDQCMMHNIRPMVWSPFAGGALFDVLDNDAAKRVHKIAQPLCEKYNAQMDQIFLAWLLRHPSKMMPVIGTTKIERIKAAAEALKIKLTRTEWYDLWQASTGEEIA